MGHGRGYVPLTLNQALEHLQAQADVAGDEVLVVETEDGDFLPVYAVMTIASPPPVHMGLSVQKPRDY